MYRPTRKGEAENDGCLTKAIDELQARRREITNDPKLRQLVARVPRRRLRRRQAERPDAGRTGRQADDPAGSERPARTTSCSPTSTRTPASTSWPRQTFLKAREVKPNDPAVYLQLAGYYNRQGDFTKTIEALDQRVSVEPNNPEAYYTRRRPTTGTRPTATSA